jgi:hypothetical protein
MSESSFGYESSSSQNDNNVLHSQNLIDKNAMKSRNIEEKLLNKDEILLKKLTNCKIILGKSDLHFNDFRWIQGKFKFQSMQSKN